MIKLRTLSQFFVDKFGTLVVEEFFSTGAVKMNWG